MDVVVEMPQLGESVTEGTLLTWLKQPGDAVAKYESIAEIETDKVNAELPSPAEGIFGEQLIEEGVTVAVGQPVCTIRTAEASPPALTEVAVSPAVRTLAKEHGVDISLIPGTGEGGRVSKRDVLDFVASRGANGASDSETTVPFTAARRSIAEHMARSKQTSPHAWLSMEVDMSQVELLRADDPSLTYLPFAAKAVCDALRQVPSMNASYSDKGIVLKQSIHLGIAVALEDNLLVPVLRDADTLGVLELAASMADLAERARNGQLRTDELSGGTFTINNTGALGAVLSAPIINQPQAGILATDRVVKRAVVVGDQIVIRPIMNLSLSFDHRINDGLQASRFLREVKARLEHFA